MQNKLGWFAFFGTKSIYFADIVPGPRQRIIYLTRRIQVYATFGNFHQAAALIKIKSSVPSHSAGDVHQAGRHLEILF